MWNSLGERGRRAAEIGLRVLSLAFGLAALAFTGIYANWLISNPRSDVTALSYLWQWIRFWPGLVMQLPVRLPVIESLGLAAAGASSWVRHLAVYAGSIVLSAVLAGSLNRSRPDWAILSVFFPYVAPVVLALLRKKRSAAADFLSRMTTVESSTQIVVDLMVIVLKVRPGVLIQISGREEAERFATKILNDELPGAKLTSRSKLAIQQAPDSVSVSEAQKGLPDTLRTEMGKAGLDPSAYNTRPLTVTESGNTYLCMLAIRR